MAQRKAEQQLLNNLFARIRELEDLYLEATGNEAPPSSFDLDLGVGSGQAKTRRFKTERARHATVVSEDMAALTHPIIKEGKTARDKRMEVLAATQDLFVTDLEKLWTCFLLPLRDGVSTVDNSPLVDVAQMSSLYDNVPALLDLHKTLRHELDSRIAQWVKCGELVGDVLQKYAALLRSAHRFSPEREFITLNGWRTEHPHARDIDALIRSAEKSCNDSLSNLMLQPSLRVGSYIVILEEMLVHMPPQHPDRSNMVLALGTFKEIEAWIVSNNGGGGGGGGGSGEGRAGLRSSLSNTRLPTTPERKLSQSGERPLNNNASVSSSPRANNTGTLRHRLQHSLSLTMVKVGDNLRKRAGTGSDFFTPPAAGGASGGAGGATAAASPPGVTPLPVVDLIEPLQLTDALAKLFHPDGCEDEFENVFLGLFHYFMSWSLFINRFGHVAKQVKDIPLTHRQRHTNRLVQVVTKWLRINQHLRGEHMPEEEAKAELENFIAREEAVATVASPSAVPPAAASGALLSSPRDSNGSSPASQSSMSGRSSLTLSSPRATQIESPRALQVEESEDESSDVVLSSPKFVRPPLPTTDAVTVPPLVVPTSGSATHAGSPGLVSPGSVSSPAGVSGRRGSSVVMGSKKRASLFQESQTVTRTLTDAQKLEELDKHLGTGGESDSSEMSPAAHLTTSRRASSLFFVTVMDEWVKSLPSDEYLPLLKYWEQYKFPKKTRTERRDSLYYRSLQKSKASQSLMDAPEFLSLDPEVLSRQFCLQELNTFKCITRTELCKRNFMEPETGPHFQYMVSQFNLWTGWVLNVVLQPDSVQDRAVIVGRLIDVADACHEMNNFNSSYAIVAGLTHPQLARLKLTWDAVNKPAMKKFTKLLEWWDVSANYKRYRDGLKGVAPPCVPYLGLLGKDLFSIEENSKTLLSSPTNRIVVNFKKLRLIWSTVSFVENLQQYEYPRLTEDAKCASYLASVKALDEGAAKARSRLLEPRATK